MPTNPPLFTSKPFQAYLAQWLQPTVDAWRRMTWKDPYARLYLYYRPNGGGLFLAEDHPANDWVLASPVRLHPSWSNDEMAAHIRNVLSTLPILPVD